MSNNIDKKSVWVTLIFFVIFIAAIFYWWCSVENAEKSTLAYNDKFVKDFKDHLADEGIQIVSEQQYIVKRYDDPNYPGSYIRTNVGVREDIYDADYHHLFELYDPTIDYTFDEELSHIPKEKISIDDDKISFYRENARKYFDHFELLRSIIADYGGEAECLTGYKPSTLVCIILAYLPDYDAMSDACLDFHENGISFPAYRLIACSDKDTFQYMKENIGSVKPYIQGKSYGCNNAAMTRDDIDLEHVCNILLGDRQKNYSVTHVPDAQDLGSPIMRNMLRLQLKSTDYIVLSEFEIGAYYLTVYESN